jgi:Na+-driven multidrug efflux pump
MLADQNCSRRLSAVNAKYWLTDWLVIILLLIIWGCLVLFVSPHHRIFFPNDTGIQYPKLKETFTTFSAYILVCVLPLAVLFVVFLVKRRLHANDAEVRALASCNGCCSVFF